MSLLLSREQTASLAAAVRELLAPLEAELAKAASPERVALQQLGVDRTGRVRAPYDEPAFATWSARLTAAPGELATLHHLAIMYHARAFDREQGPSPESAVADWRGALQLWHQLWGSDAFWQGLATRLGPGPGIAAVAQLRVEFPTLLLNVHRDLALALAATPERARTHLALIRESPFPESIREEVGNEAYARFISQVPASVWSSTTLDPQLISLGSAAVAAWLELDPDSPAAMADAVRLQVRVLGAGFLESPLTTESADQREQRLRQLQQEAARWRPRFDLLVGRASTLQGDLRENLGLWYRAAAELHRALGLAPLALDYYEQGVRVALPGDDEGRRCRRGLPETRAEIARGMAYDEEPAARARCDEIRTAPELTVTARRLLVEAYARLWDFAAAEEVAQAGLAAAPVATEQTALDQAYTQLARTLADLRMLRRRIEAQHWRDQARYCLAQTPPAYAQAVALLTEAVAGWPEDLECCALRREIQEVLHQLPPAQQDLAVSNGPGLPQLRRELASVLCQWAADEMKQVLSNPQLPPAEQERQCLDLQRRLQEARDLNPADTRVQQLLAAMRESLAGFAEVRRAEEHHAILGRELGGGPGLAHFDRAIAALNQDQWQEAVAALEALVTFVGEERPQPELQPEAPEVAAARHEISLVLLHAAVTAVNRSATWQQRRAVLQQARRLLAAALRYTPEDRGIRTQLATVDQLLAGTRR